MNMPLSTEKVLYSEFGLDPDLGEIVELFVQEMPDRVATLLDCLGAGDREGLRRVAHQLKGAAGSYGFQSISPCAADVENRIRQGAPEEQIRQGVDILVEMCRCVRAGGPQPQAVY